LSADDLSGVDPDEYRHTESVLKKWFQVGGGKVPKGEVDQLRNYAIYNCKRRTFTAPLMTAPGGSGFHDCNLLHEFDFDLLPESELTFRFDKVFLAFILDLVCQSNILFLPAC
jgi:hypothetical protein